jgi:isoamylase
LLLDPYARAIGGEVVWDRRVLGFDRDVGPYRADGRDRRDSADAVPRCLVVDSAFDWADDRPPRIRYSDSVIYEVHVKGFTARHPGVPPQLRGTYAGLAHSATIDHLHRLRATAVELLPVHQHLTSGALQGVA